MERLKSNIKAIVLAIFLTAIAAAGVNMTNPLLSEGQQAVFILFAAVVTCVLLKNLFAGLAACGTAWLMFTLVAPHLPTVLDHWPR